MLSSFKVRLLAVILIFVSSGANPQSTVEGVDVSKWQGDDVDFHTIHTAAKTYVFIRATEGDSYVDPDFLKNYAAAREAGLIVGAYHFYVTKDDPKTQFKNFSENISLAKGDLPPVIDIETLTDGGSAHLTQDLDTFLKLLTQKYKSPPILYSGEYFASEHLSSFGKYPLWIAEYSDVSSPKLPSGWTTWTFWQHTQSGSVKGVEGRVDLDRFNGSLSDLHDLTIQ